MSADDISGATAPAVEVPGSGMSRRNYVLGVWSGTIGTAAYDFHFNADQLPPALTRSSTTEAQSRRKLLLKAFKPSSSFCQRANCGESSAR